MWKVLSRGLIDKISTPQGLYIILSIKILKNNTKCWWQYTKYTLQSRSVYESLSLD